MSQLDPTTRERSDELVEARELRVYLRAIGDLARLQIMRQLAQNGEMGVTELARALRVSQPLLSFHLGVLKRAYLVSVRKEGRSVFYSLDRQTLRSFGRRFDAWVGEIGESPDKDGGKESV